MWCRMRWASRKRLVLSEQKRWNRSLVVNVSFGKWCRMRWASRNVLVLSEQKRWTEAWCRMLVWHVMWDEMSESQRLVLSEQKRWTEVCWRMFRLACDVGWGERVATFGSKWAKEVNRSLLVNVGLTCDVGWGERVATFGSKWSKRGEQKFYEECSFGVWM